MKWLSKVIDSDGKIGGFPGHPPLLRLVWDNIKRVWDRFGI